MQEGKMARFVRGLVKFVFILCYVAFMWASIHHVATFFNAFEQNGTDTVGSLMVAGAFDVTSLVTTIGVMFFRKSMPRYVQIIVWIFIVAIAGYSFFINWEYAAHFQSATLTLQPTGAMQAIYDAQGTLHYIPVMRQNTGLLLVNPVLASLFTVFSLIYSVIAEFFGTKAPTLEELQAKKKYLEETATVLDDIRKMEEQRKGKSLLQSAKEQALAVKDAVQEVRSSNVIEQDEVSTIEASEHEQSDNTIAPELPGIQMSDKVEMALEFFAMYPEYAEENGPELDAKLAEFMGLKRPASARFWKLKALEIWQNSARNSDEIPTYQRRTTDPLQRRIQSEIDAEFRSYPDANFDEDTARNSAEEDGEISSVVQENSARICDEIDAKLDEDTTTNTPRNCIEIQSSEATSEADASSRIESVSESVRRPYSMTYDEASALTGYSAKFLKSRVNTGEIGVTSGGKLKTKDVLKFRRIITKNQTTK